MLALATPGPAFSAAAPGAQVHVRNLYYDGDSFHVRISYRVRGRDTIGTFKIENGIEDPREVRLVPFPGESHPVVMLLPEEDGRDVAVFPSFYRLNTVAHALEEIPVYEYSNDSKASAGAPCFTVANPRELYFWQYDSAIPIRDKLNVKYYAVRTNDRVPIVVKTDDVYELGSDAPKGATPPPSLRLNGMRLHVSIEDGRPYVSPCGAKTNGASHGMTKR